MPTKLDRMTTALSAALLVAALLACKKRTPVPTAPSAEAVASAGNTAPASQPPPAVAAEVKLPDVKRYADREKAQTGTARILEEGTKVFAEADEKTAELVTLPKGLVVTRLASIPDWELVEFPSGLGKVSPGWVQAKLVDVKANAPLDNTAAKAAAATSASAAPAKSASLVASAKPAASSAASAKPAASTAAAKAAADKAAADKAAADKAAADKAAADKAAARAARTAARAAAKAKAAAEQAAAGK